MTWEPSAKFSVGSDITSRPHPFYQNALGCTRLHMLTNSTSLSNRPSRGRDAESRNYTPFPFEDHQKRLHVLSLRPTLRVRQRLGGTGTPPGNSKPTRIKTPVDPVSSHAASYTWQEPEWTKSIWIFFLETMTSVWRDHLQPTLQLGFRLKGYC
jgi:hypothetical protein